MNKRKVFDKVAKHLLDQGKKSRGFHGYCAYRGVDGLTCAVGCLIPDDIYDSSMEGVNIGALIMNYPPMAELFSEHYELLTDLQVIHDNRRVADWEEALEAKCQKLFT